MKLCCTVRQKIPREPLKLFLTPGSFSKYLWTVRKKCPNSWQISQPPHFHVTWVLWCLDPNLQAGPLVEGVSMTTTEDGLIQWNAGQFISPMIYMCMVCLECHQFVTRHPLLDWVFGIPNFLGSIFRIAGTHGRAIATILGYLANCPTHWPCWYRCVLGSDSALVHDEVKNCFSSFSNCIFHNNCLSSSFKHLFKCTILFHLTVVIANFRYCDEFFMQAFWIHFSLSQKSNWLVGFYEPKQQSLWSDSRYTWAEACVCYFNFSLNSLSFNFYGSPPGSSGLGFSRRENRRAAISSRDLSPRDGISRLLATFALGRQILYHWVQTQEAQIHRRD